jgi:hypothetical protein
MKRKEWLPVSNTCRGYQGFCGKNTEATNYPLERQGLQDYLIYTGIDEGIIIGMIE